MHSTTQTVVSEHDGKQRDQAACQDCHKSKKPKAVTGVAVTSSGSAARPSITHSTALSAIWLGDGYVNVFEVEQKKALKEVFLCIKSFWRKVALEEVCIFASIACEATTPQTLPYAEAK